MEQGNNSTNIPTNKGEEKDVKNKVKTQILKLYEIKNKKAKYGREFGKQKKQNKNIIGTSLKNVKRKTITLKNSQKVIKLSKNTTAKRHTVNDSYSIIYELWGQKALVEIMKLIETEIRFEKQFMTKSLVVKPSDKIVLNM
jgi:hypothetical protein